MALALRCAGASLSIRIYSLLFHKKTRRSMGSCHFLRVSPRRRTPHVGAFTRPPHDADLVFHLRYPLRALGRAPLRKP